MFVRTRHLLVMAFATHVICPELIFYFSAHLSTIDVFFPAAYVSSRVIYKRQEIRMRNITKAFNE